MQQILSKKNTYSTSIKSRNMKTGQVTSDDKIARISDSEAFVMVASGQDMALREFMGSRADATDSKNSLYNQIATYGYASLADMPSDLSKKTTLNTINTYLLAAGIANDLMDDSDKLTIDTFTEGIEQTVEGLMPLNEVSNFVDKADMYSNLNTWKKQAGNNILYVLGLSGSGKSTISNALKEKYKAEVIELDAIEQKKTDCTPKEKALIKLAESQFPAYEAMDYDLLGKLGSIMEYPKYTRSVAMPVIKYIIEEVLYKENHLYIVEGIQLFELYQPQQLVDKPMIFKNTSTLQSILRRMKRNNDGEHINWTKELRLSLLSDSLWMADSARRLDKYSKAAEKHARENGGEIQYKKEEEVKPTGQNSSENIKIEDDTKDKTEKESKKDDKKEGEK